MGDLQNYMGDIARQGSGAPISDDERIRQLVAQMPPYLQQDKLRAIRIAQAMLQPQGQPAQRVFRPQPQSTQLPPQGSPGVMPPGSQALGAGGWSGQMPQQAMAKLAGMFGGGQPQSPQPGPDFDHSFAGLGVPPGTPGIEQLQGGGFSMNPDRNAQQPPWDIAAMQRFKQLAQGGVNKAMGMFGSNSAAASPMQQPQPPSQQNVVLPGGSQYSVPLNMPQMRQMPPTSGMPRQMQQPTFAGPQAQPQGQEQYPFVANNPDTYGEPQDQADLNYDLIQRYLRHMQGR